MSAFLSHEWLRELAAAAEASPALQAAARGVELTVGHVVTGAPAGDVAYAVRFSGGRVEVVSGQAEADVEVQQEYATAAAISQGKLAPAEAFATGRMRLGGRPGLLAEHREALSHLDDAFADLRARTAY